VAGFRRVAFVAVLLVAAGGACAGKVDPSHGGSGGVSGDQGGGGASVGAGGNGGGGGAGGGGCPPTGPTSGAPCDVNQLVGVGNFCSYPDGNMCMCRVPADASPSSGMWFCFGQGA
jgi:hypothetical protein